MLIRFINTSFFASVVRIPVLCCKRSNRGRAIRGVAAALDQVKPLLPPTQATDAVAAIIMDEKRAMSPIRPSCPSRRTRLPITLALAGLCLYLFYHVHIYVHPLPTIADPDRWYGAPASEPPSPVQASRKLVPLEAHIMSKCPDARVSPG